jgi:hypothetical protein
MKSLGLRLIRPEDCRNRKLGRQQNDLFQARYGSHRLGRSVTGDTHLPVARGELSRSIEGTIRRMSNQPPPEPRLVPMEFWFYGTNWQPYLGHPGPKQGSGGNPQGYWSRSCLIFLVPVTLLATLTALALRQVTWFVQLRLA